MTNATVGDVMVQPVMTITKHETLGHARDVMTAHKVSALPVVGPDREPLGIITTFDLLDGHGHPDGAPVSTIMSKPTFSVHPSDGPQVAARIMRNHHLHHVLVIDDGALAGMVSTFDLLRLVEDHRFQARQAPTPRRKANART